MTARNDITGDAIQTKGPSDAYRDGWERIFGKKQPAPSQQAKPTTEEVEASLAPEKNEGT